MLIEMTADPVRGRLQALLRIPEPPNAQIELEIKLVGASGAPTERAVAVGFAYLVGVVLGKPG